MSEFLSVSDLARSRGVSKQAISKRLKAFGSRVSSRRDKGALLVSVADYDREAGANTDPAQLLRNVNQAPQVAAQSAAAAGTGLPPVASPPPAGTRDTALNVYSAQRARQASFDAELTKLKLEKETGRWLEAAKAEQAWGRALSTFVAETETFIVNRLAREISDAYGLPWKDVAVKARDLFHSYCANRAAQGTDASNHGAAH